MVGYGYYNGKFAPCEEIFLPLTDRAVYFGDGIYDAMVGMGEKIYLVGEHINRLLSGARKIKLCHGYTHEELLALMRETVQRSGYKEFFLYCHLTRAGEGRVHSYCPAVRTNLLITVTPHTLSGTEKILSVITREDLRYRYCNVKTLNLLPSVLAAGDAEEAGCDEAVFIRDGAVTECAHSNIFILKDKVLYTHPTDDKILPGITRRHLIKVAKRAGVPTRERPFSLSELMNADEVIITSTTKRGARVGRLDGVAVGMREPELARRLLSLLNDDMNRESSE